MIAEKDSIALAGNITPDESIRMTIRPTRPTT